MTEENRQDGGDDPSNLQHLLILAYARLWLLPESIDGTKFCTIASRGSLELRLVEYPLREPVPPLWIELVNPRDGQVIKCIGCRDLQEAGAATERLFYDDLSGTTE